MCISNITSRPWTRRAAAKHTVRRPASDRRGGIMGDLDDLNHQSRAASP